MISLNLERSADRCPLTADSVLAPNTKKFMNHYQALQNYCSLTGDYESLLMLHEDAPREHCPSISDETIRNFIIWKRSTAGDPHIVQGSQIYDVDGNPMVCSGG